MPAIVVKPFRLSLVVQYSLYKKLPIAYVLSEILAMAPTFLLHKSLTFMLFFYIIFGVKHLYEGASIQECYANAM